MNRDIHSIATRAGQAVLLLLLLATMFGACHIQALSSQLYAAVSMLNTLDQPSLQVDKPALQHHRQQILTRQIVDLSNKLQQRTRGLSLVVAGLALWLAGLALMSYRRAGRIGLGGLNGTETADLTLNALPSAVLRFTLDGRLSQLNPAAQRMIGISQGDALAQPLADTLNVIAREDRSPLVPALLNDLRQGNLASLGEQACLITQEGLELEVEGQAAPILATGGHAAEGVLVMRDVTEAREQQRKQAWLAEHDALTGILNRKAFEDKLARVINSKRASEYPMTLLVVGIDSYEAVRNREGPSAGNELLIQIARLLQTRLRDSDSIGRLDETQFGIALAACPDDVALRIARTLLESLSQHKLHWGKNEYLIDISMGVVHIPPNWETLDRVMTAGRAACAQSRSSRAIAVHAN